MKILTLLYYEPLHSRIIKLHGIFFSKFCKYFISEDPHVCNPNVCAILIHYIFLFENTTYHDYSIVLLLNVMYRIAALIEYIFDCYK